MYLLSPSAPYRKCPRTNRINRQKQNNVHFSSENTMRASTRLIWAQTHGTESPLHFMERCGVKCSPLVGQPRKLGSASPHSSSPSLPVWTSRMPRENGVKAKTELAHRSEWDSHVDNVVISRQLPIWHFWNLSLAPGGFSEKLNHEGRGAGAEDTECEYVCVWVCIRCVSFGRGGLADVCHL